MSEHTMPFDHWAIVEIFGHTRLGTMTLDQFFTLQIELQQQHTRVLDKMSQRLSQLQEQIQQLTDVLTAILEADEEEVPMENGECRMEN